MSNINYDNKYFIGVENYDDGDLNRNTVFRYRQKGKVVWGSFEGGKVLHGNFVARLLDDNKLEMSWQYLNQDEELHHGTCLSTPEIMPNGKIRLHECWQLTTADRRSGTSVIQEVGS